MVDDLICPNCGAGSVSVFYTVDKVPVHSVLVFRTRAEALAFPKGDVRLGFCSACGFIGNTAHEATFQAYSQAYESTQSYSPTFNRFHRNLAGRLIERYDLHGKKIIEIGCGQGEFLILLCEMGPNSGVGFDPAYDHNRIQSETKERIQFIPDYYSEKYANVQGDLVICKMTLEHIRDTAEFVRNVRRSIGHRPATTVFFQVPDVRRILRERAFWDIYYEHVSYFSPGSLARLFRGCGFQVTDLWTDYDDQYLMLEAHPGDELPGNVLPLEEKPQELAGEVTAFAETCQQAADDWKRRILGYNQSGHHLVLWGGGSKAVAFLTTLGLAQEVEYVVDINAHKHGTFLPGTGQVVVAPDFLLGYHPDVVVVMNPIYCPEIQQELDRMGLHHTELVAVA